jgi:hypothetical protein
MTRRLALFILRLKTLASLFGVKIAADWSPNDRRRLAHFFATTTGTRFVHQVRNLAIQVTLEACYKPNGPDYARGYQDCFNQLITLSALDPQQLVAFGRVPLTDNKGNAETDEEEEPSPEYGYGGSSIGYK